MYVVCDLRLFSPEFYTFCLVIFSQTGWYVFNYMEQSAAAGVHISLVKKLPRFREPDVS